LQLINQTFFGSKGVNGNKGVKNRIQVKSPVLVTLGGDIKR